MLPLTNPLHNAHAWCLLVLLILCQSVRSRPVKDDSLADLLLEVIKDRMIEKEMADNKLDIKDGHQIDSERDYTHIPFLSNREETPKPRTKRVGIAGNENIDLILSTLGRNANSRGNPNGRFRPLLSITGSFGDLRSMMQKAG